MSVSSDRDRRRGVETELFGLRARGSRFLYVLDRSASMSELGGKPLRTLKAELEKSLLPLTEQEEFQIIFYNHRPRLMQVESGSPQLLWRMKIRSRGLDSRFKASMRKAEPTICGRCSWPWGSHQTSCSF